MTASPGSSAGSHGTPAGLADTVAPPSLSENFTASINGENRATTDVSWSSTRTVHELLVPQSGSLQPKKLFPAPGSTTAFSRTLVPCS